MGDSDAVMVAVLLPERVALALRLQVRVLEADTGVPGLPVTLTEDDTVIVTNDVVVADGDEHIVLPADEYCPALQLPLQFAVVMPTALPYRPALQFVHAPAPASENCPAGQTTAVGVVDCAGHA